MKARILAMLFPLMVSCATATQVATSVGVSTGVITGGQKRIIDQTAVKTQEAARPISESEEYYIGRAVAARIASQYKPYKHFSTVWYVNHVGATLAVNSSRPCTYGGYHFAVLDTHEINAFACPGGIVFVTRGMLDLVENEDQLAAVLAHEIGHVCRKHGLDAIQKARWAEAATTLGMTTASEYTGAQLAGLVTLFDGTVNDVFQTLVVNGYGRSDEYEADALAMGTMKRAGYDPGEFIHILEKLDRAQDHRSDGILATHPHMADRVERARDCPELAGRGPAPCAARAARFQNMAKTW
jgi:predicted Zn-dependent protease